MLLAHQEVCWHAGWLTSSDDLHRRAGRLRVRGPPAGRLRGPAGRLPGHSPSSVLVSLLLLPPRPAGERAEGPSGRGLPPGPLRRSLRPAAGLPLLPRQPAAAAAAVAQGPLRRGRGPEGPTPGSRGEVSREEEVPSALHHLGWRGDQLLLQGWRRKKVNRLSTLSCICMQSRVSQLVG